MRYFKKTEDNGKTYALSESQISKGFNAGLVEIGQEEYESRVEVAQSATKITKLQAVRYFQNNGVWSDIKAAILSDEDRLDRWDATTVLVIDDADVIALASAAEALTGKDVQTMFNEAREL